MDLGNINKDESETVRDTNGDEDKEKVVCIYLSDPTVQDALIHDRKSSWRPNFPLQFVRIGREALNAACNFGQVWTTCSMMYIVI